VTTHTDYSHAVNPEKPFSFWNVLVINSVEKKVVLAACDKNKGKALRKAKRLCPGMPAFAFDLGSAGPGGKVVARQVEVFLAEHDILGAEALHVQRAIGEAMRRVLRRGDPCD
jgi:hypothetical protein